jgi:tellurite resistance protein
MAILAAPPAVGGLAWFALTGERVGIVAIAFAGVGALMVAVQLALLPRYVALGFSLGFWSFTFTAGAIVADTIIWLGLGAVPGAAAISIALLVAVTVLIGGVGVRSLLALRR